jgi:mono/diheme cytochrome c family protein
MRTSFTSMALVALAATLTACGGDKAASTPATDSAATAPADAAPTAAPTDSAAPVASAAAYDPAKGQELYGRCMACHQQNGAGMPGAFPPLAESEWVNGPASRPIAILLHGLQGEITVKGTKYNSMMMAYGTGVPMSDDEIATVLTYVRSNFGNNAPAVTAAEVATVRAATAGRSTPMTQKDLEALQ